MITFILSVLALVAGYFIYGRFVESLIGPDDRPTPAVTKADGIDFVVLPSWKIFMIQFLNIAGTGPIFGAIMGMWYGPVAYLWIVFGCIFAGATHDYLAGMLSIRSDGASLPELVGHYLGEKTRQAMLIFCVCLLVLVGAVFVLSPASLLASLIGGDSFGGNVLFWIGVVFFYYVVATMLPVDKIIGKVYPVFAIALIFMAIALMVCLLLEWPTLPELWDGIGNLGEQRLGIKNSDPIFPALFITIACGAISGFHATQSPLMARCMKSEKLGRPIFYGAMITEGLVALIWATIASYFFYDNGWREVCSPETIQLFTSQSDKTITQFFTAPKVVMEICYGWLGMFGGVLAVLGVVAAPITSGDTALRSARLIVADWLEVDQKPIGKRMYISLPLFAITLLLLWWQMDNPDSFNVIWKYFGLANQALSIFTLWTLTVYLVQKDKPFVVTLIPAVFMTVICVTFLAASNTALAMPVNGYVAVAVTVAIASITWFLLWKHKKMF